jgi:hypothetical protein
MSTDTIITILIKEGFNFAKNECCICYEKFIDNLSSDELFKVYYKSLRKKYNLNDDNLDDDLFWSELRCYSDRFECLTCRNVVCDTCIQNIPQEDGATGDFTTTFNCPICRTKDFRYKIDGNYLPVEILRDIKNLKNK